MTIEVVSQTVPRSTYAHVDGCHAYSSIGLELARRISEDYDELDEVYCSGCRCLKPIIEFAWVGRDGRVDDRVRKVSE